MTEVNTNINDKENIEVATSNGNSNLLDAPIQISISLPTQAYFLSGIRDFTLNLIKNLTDFNEKWAYRFQSIVDELCNNAIEHGSEEGQEIKITFENLANKYIEIKVEDTGTGKTPMKAEEIKALVEKRRESNELNTMLRGRGLPKIVAEWSDELEFKNTDKNGIIVRVRKYINQELLNGTNLNGQSKDPTHIILN